jgi:hypothetical protein
LAIMIGHSVSLPFNHSDGLATRVPDHVIAPRYSELAVAVAGVRRGPGTDRRSALKGVLPTL